MSGTGTGLGSGPYSRAPIVEAVVDVQVGLPPTTTLEVLREIHGDERDAYPQRQVRTQVQGEIRFEAGVATTQADQTEVGYAFLSTDAARQFHARLDGFSYLQRTPYTQWEDFSSECLRLWASYVKSAKPQVVTRVGVRFVNRVDIPAGSVELKDYFRTTAEVSPDLPQVISGLFVQVQLPVVADGVSANITSTLVPPPSPGTTAVLLDIDVFSQAGLLTSSSDFDNQFEQVLERLRRAKNHVFEACITDATRELIR